jgi:hypothetical protein
MAPCAAVRARWGGPVTGGPCPASTRHRWNPRPSNAAPTRCPAARVRAPVRPPVSPLCERAYRGGSSYCGLTPALTSARRQGAAPAIKTAGAGLSPCARRRGPVWHAAATAPYLQSTPQRPAPLTLVALHCWSAPRRPSVAPTKSSPEPSFRRMPPGRAADPHHRHNPDPNQAHKSNLGEPHTLSLHFLGQRRRRSRSIPASRARLTPKGYIASSQLFPGWFL